MAKVDWPAADKRTLIGKRIDRIDGPLKATGAAKYSYDINRPGMLWARAVTSPYAHAEVTSIDTRAAEALPGVKGVWRDTRSEEHTSELQSHHDLVCRLLLEKKKKNTK